MSTPPDVPAISELSPDPVPRGWFQRSAVAHPILLLLGAATAFVWLTQMGSALAGLDLMPAKLAELAVLVGLAVAITWATDRRRGVSSTRRWKIVLRRKAKHALPPLFTSSVALAVATKPATGVPSSPNYPSVSTSGCRASPRRHRRCRRHLRLSRPGPGNLQPLRGRESPTARSSRSRLPGAGLGGRLQGGPVDDLPGRRRHRLRAGRPSHRHVVLDVATATARQPRRPTPGTDARRSEEEGDEGMGKPAKCRATSWSTTLPARSPRGWACTWSS